MPTYKDLVLTQDEIEAAGRLEELCETVLTPDELAKADQLGVLAGRPSATPRDRWVVVRFTARCFGKHGSSEQQREFLHLIDRLGLRVNTVAQRQAILQGIVRAGFLTSPRWWAAFLGWRLRTWWQRRWSGEAT
jgi:hypothetical protein